MRKQTLNQSGKFRQMFLNYKQLSITRLRRRILFYANEAVKSVIPLEFMGDLIRKKKNFLLIKNKRVLIKRRIFIIGLGKAAATMAIALEKILGLEKITAGLVVTNDAFSRPKKIKVLLSSHPLPTFKSVFAAKQILKFKRQHKIGQNDLVIASISGGGSSLVSLPVVGISLSQKRDVIEKLIHSGANVHEMTAVKKKLSQIKGGKLAQYFYPARILNLVLSDVVDNNLSVIASGPFNEDKTTLEEALSILFKYRLNKKVPLAVLNFLDKKNNGSVGDFNHVSNFVLADNKTAVDRVAELAKKDGFRVQIKTKIQGEARKLAEKWCENIFVRSVQKPTLFIFGGEMTVTLPKVHGLGGRNQEFVVACLNYLKNKKILGKWCVLSLATDGVDYHLGSAGGIIDDQTLKAVEHDRVDLMKVLRQHSSYNLLNKLKSNLKIGRPTGTNVCDLILFYREPV